ncbi:MAG: hypothetical protein KZQ87_06440 [Candidatus Thiodiazotropha sp. (ex Cardiolucina cf. quadrata)]|nr:hypothetical protein [Candidatus Thiodiazotropha sp. (ex Cardiolucina cf. quadrata)]
MFQCSIHRRLLQPHCAFEQIPLQIDPVQILHPQVSLPEITLLTASLIEQLPHSLFAGWKLGR